jgi:hypothetical protein
MSDLSGECLDKNSELEDFRQWHRITFKAIQGDGSALWPERYPIRVLRAIERDFELQGNSYQFASLYQQDPRANPELAEWPDDYFRDVFFTGFPEGFNARLHVLACDPSKGANSDPGDYCAFAHLYLTWDNELFVEMRLRRQPTTEMIEDLSAELLSTRPDAVTIEEQEDRGPLAELLRGRLDAEYCPIPVRAYWSTERKEYRIRTALDEWLRLHRIRFLDNIGGRLSVRQLQEFPSGEHDDGPDAIAMGLTLIAELMR